MYTVLNSIHANIVIEKGIKETINEFISDIEHSKIVQQVHTISIISSINTRTNKHFSS